jgi:hypothetical protein
VTEASTLDGLFPTPPPPADLIEVPFTWLELITRFPEVATVDEMMRAFNVKTYFIAGGYYRDKLNGRDFKDIDVFVPGLESLENSPRELAIRYDQFTAAEIEHEGLAINVIGLHAAHSLTTLLNRMDIGLCQIGKGLNGKVYCTRAYLEDVTSNTLSVRFKPSIDSDFDHIQRVSAKYPEMPVVHLWATEPAPQETANV